MGKRYRHRHKFDIHKIHDKEIFLFNNIFEERKALAYMGNLLRSKFLARNTEGILYFSIEMLGRKEVASLIEEVYPNIAKEGEFKKWRDRNSRCLHDVLERKGVNTVKFLRSDIATALDARLAKVARVRDRLVEPRLAVVGKTFGLTGTELEIASYFYLKEADSAIHEHMTDIIPDLENISTFRSHGHAVLGVQRSPFLKALSDGNLFKARVIEKGKHTSSLEMASWCVDYLSGLVKADLASEFFTKENDEPLALADFDISRGEMAVLDTLLKGKKPANILLYGAAGTGKSSFTRSLARNYGLELLTVKHPESDEHKDRLHAVYATVNLADRKNAIVLVDEADEILNSSSSMFFESKTNKSWINTFLEGHDKKVVWITNRSSQVDPSTMRRFAFSVEFKKLDPEKRCKVLKHELAKKGLKESYFTEDELKELCRGYAVDAGGIVNAVSALTITSRTKKETALAKIKTVLRNHEKATGANRADNNRERTFDTYTMECLNTSQDMELVVSAARRYLKAEKEGSTRKMAVSMLFYGMPGTGKTEFVHYLGYLLKKKVLLKRCSDIQSMWVGQTEKNIARAFREARETGDILLFDEADSFLFPRSQAHQSWEKGFTNEILTQLENHSGIVVFATNDMDGLDHAALRRFKFKVQFRPLTPDGVLHLYERMLEGLAANELSGSDARRLRAMKSLTPGDFAVVRDQFSLLEPEEITHGMLIDALANEVRYKKEGGRSIGF